MGSSKKSKDKDKNREEKRKRKHRSRSRSKDRERHHRHKHKKRSHRREQLEEEEEEQQQEQQQQLSRSKSPLSDVSDVSSDNDIIMSGFAEAAPAAPPPPPRISLPMTPSPPPPPPPPPSGKRGQKRGHGGDEVEEGGRSSKRGREGGVGGGWEDQQPSTAAANGDGGAASLSLSIDETNKIRAKLGLKPLQVESTASATQQEGQKDDDDGPDLEPGETKMKEDSQEFIHKPAQNLRDKLQVEKLREKIAVQREKRRLKDKLSKVRTLADSDSEDDSLAWVNKSRKLTKEKLEAEKKAKQLEELDAQFGIGELVEEEVAKDQRKAYGRNHLSGLKVQHHHTRFGEGSTILTLADSDVLGVGEDTLINVNLVDQEVAERNIERRRKKDDLEYEAPEVDDGGAMLQNNMLKKYDDELLGPATSSFRLGRRGLAVMEDEALQGLGEKQRRLAKLQQLHSLNHIDNNRLEKEYLTHDEATTLFKKPKKLRKKSKRLRADDLEPLEDSEEHHGSRGRRVEANSRPEPGEDVTDRIKSLRELMMEDDLPNVNDMDVQTNDNYGEDDGIDDDFELQEALARSRKAKLAKLHQPKVEDLRGMLESSEPSSSSRAVDLSSLLADGAAAPVPDAGLALNTTDEFCRTLGDIPTYGLSGNRADEEQNSLHLLLNKAPVESPGAAGAWEEVGIEDTKVEISEQQSVPILDEEPDASRGVANALRLAIKKGYLEKSETSKKGSTTLQHLRAINYSIDDKAGDDDRRGRGGDRYAGPLTEFREKDGYKPKISLEYVDDEGRKLCPKEAFRYLSHKFHGKGSGKNKTEKRMKKWQEELLMKQMSSSDTPLQTLERQIDKQKQLGTSYLLLSGSKNQEPAAAAETRIRK